MAFEAYDESFDVLRQLAPAGVPDTWPWRVGVPTDLVEQGGAQARISDAALVPCPSNGCLRLEYLGVDPQRYWLPFPFLRWESFGEDGWGLCTDEGKPGDVLDYYSMPPNGVAIGSTNVPAIIAPLIVRHDLYVWTTRAVLPTYGWQRVRLKGRRILRRDFTEERRAFV